MLSPSQFQELVSGKQSGPAAAVLRGLLRVAETPYSLAVRWRNRRYDRGAAESIAVDAPVVSVGNLTMGGTGKTPMVQWIARWFRQRDVRVTLVSRGYGAEAGAANDEALELEKRLPDVPHLQNPDRVQAARTAIEELDAQVILLDDGFQHRRLRRDLDIVLLDAFEPFGYGHVFPRGMLREPPRGLSRAHVVVLSRADMLDKAARAAVRKQVEHYAPQAIWSEAAHAPESLVAGGGETSPLAALQGQSVAAFCGIGNPAGFRHTLDAIGYDVVAMREFPDHHAYQRADVQSLAAWAREHGAAALVCTEKDLVKLAADEIEGVPLWAVRIGMQILAGENELEEVLGKLLLKIDRDA